MQGGFLVWTRYHIYDRVSLNNHLGSLAQNRESYYISCWQLYVKKYSMCGNDTEVTE
jgi:hypothetical protein